MAHLEDRLHLRPAKVEEPVSQDHLLARLDRFVDRERQRIASTQNVYLVDLDLDLARGELRVHLVAAAHDRSGDSDDVLVVERTGDAVRLAPVGVESKLRETGLVTQVDEDNAAVVAGRVDPSGEDHGLADVGAAQLSAAIRPVIIGDRHCPYSRFESRIVESSFRAQRDRRQIGGLGRRPDRPARTEGFARIRRLARR